MNRKKYLVVASIIAVILLFSVSAFAMSGGMPGAHGVDGKTFGAAVSGLAQEDPAALVDHVSGMKGSLDEEPEGAMSGGMPGAHNMTGQEFGATVSNLAKSGPGAVAEHVANKPEITDMSGMAGGMPAAHGVDGKTFGAAVSGLAQESPEELASHVSGGRKP
jgi:hypothetical protein